MPQWSLLFWVSLLIVGFVGSFGGVLLCNFAPRGRGAGSRVRVTWYPKSGGAAGTLLSIVPAVFFLPNASTFSLLLITFFTGLIVSYLSSRLPRINQFLEKTAPPRPDPPAEMKAKAMYFRKDWNVRPRYETEEDGQFVGRTEFLERLNSHFISG